MGQSSSDKDKGDEALRWQLCYGRQHKTAEVNPADAKGTEHQPIAAACKAPCDSAFLAKSDCPSES